MNHDISRKKGGKMKKKAKKDKKTMKKEVPAFLGMSAGLLDPRFDLVVDPRLAFVV
jgi:hypothetical protein